MKQLKSYTNAELIDYLFAQGFTLIPIRDKRPDKDKAQTDAEKFTQMTNTDWCNYLHLDNIDEYAEYLKQYITKYNHGFSVVLHGEFLVVDFDPGHDNQDMLPQLTQRKELIKLLGGQRTLYAAKKNSMNLHLFYKAPRQNIRKMKFFENKKIAGDVISFNQHVRIAPDYFFKNLDISKSFYEQLSPCPEYIQNWLDEEDKRLIKQAKAFKKMAKVRVDENKDDWLINHLNKWAYQGRFTKGTRHDSILKFSLMAIYRGVPPIKVEEVMTSFVLTYMPEMADDARIAIRNAEIYAAGKNC